MRIIYEVLNFAAKQWISKGYPLNNVRYRPKESDLKELSYFSSFAELKDIVKKAKTAGFFKIVELGSDPCYTITEFGLKFLNKTAMK